VRRERYLPPCAIQMPPAGPSTFVGLAGEHDPRLHGGRDARWSGWHRDRTGSCFFAISRRGGRVDRQPLRNDMKLAATRALFQPCRSHSPRALMTCRAGGYHVAVTARLFGEGHPPGIRWIEYRRGIGDFVAAPDRRRPLATKLSASESGRTRRPVRWDVHRCAVRGRALRPR